MREMEEIHAWHTSITFAQIPMLVALTATGRRCRNSSFTRSLRISMKVYAHATAAAAGIAAANIVTYLHACKPCMRGNYISIRAVPVPNKNTEPGHCAAMIQ